MTISSIIIHHKLL